MERNEMMDSVLISEAFEKELKTASSPEHLQEILNKHGLETSLEEIQEAISASNQEELSDEELDNVAGGANFWPLNWFVVRKVVKYIVKKRR